MHFHRNSVLPRGLLVVFLTLPGSLPATDSAPDNSPTTPASAPDSESHSETEPSGTRNDSAARTPSDNDSPSEEPSPQNDPPSQAKNEGSQGQAKGQNSEPPGHSLVKKVPGTFLQPGDGRMPVHSSAYDYVKNLRSDQFTDEFRDEVRRALEQETPVVNSGILSTAADWLRGLTDSEETTIPAPSAPNVHDIPTESGSGGTQVTITYRQVIQEFHEGDRTRRIIVIRRPRESSEEQARQKLSGVSAPEPLNRPDPKGDEPERNAPLTGTSPNPFVGPDGQPLRVIRKSGESGLRPWGRPSADALKEAVEAERKFRRFDTVLQQAKQEKAAAPATGAGATAPAKASAASPGPKRPREVVEEIIYLDETGEAPVPQTTGRMAALPFSWEQGSLHFERFTRDLSGAARRYGPQIIRNVSFLSFASMAFSVLVILGWLHRKRRRSVALRSYRYTPRSRKYTTTPPPPTRIRETRGWTDTRPVALLTDGSEGAHEEASGMGREDFDREGFAGTGTYTFTGEHDVPPGQGGLGDNIRVVFDGQRHRWVIKRQDPEGGPLSPPLAELQAGTVVRGSLLGTDPRIRYRLTAHGTWLATNEPEQVILAVSLEHLRGRRGRA